MKKKSFVKFGEKNMKKSKNNIKNFKKISIRIKNKYFKSKHYRQIYSQL